jgi:multimeric flavodoxin WrbA
VTGYQGICQGKIHRSLTLKQQLIFCLDKSLIESVVIGVNLGYKQLFWRKSMRVLGISGSPRSGGNTEHLLAATLEPFRAKQWNVDLFLLSQHAVAPCTACDSCQRTGVCRIDDDMAILYNAYDRCHALIVASPVYYRNITAQLKALFDRTYAVQTARPLARKPGGAIAIGRGTSSGQALTLTIIYNFFLSCGTVCVPGELNGVSAMADAPGDILNQPKRLRQAEILGENVLSIAERLQP